MLTEQQVLHSRNAHGENRLTPPQREKWWLLLLEKFEDPLIIVLLIVLVLSAGISTYEFLSISGTSWHVFLEPLGVLIALLLATGVGFFFELRATKAFDLLNQVSDDAKVQVRRIINGVPTVTEIARWEVVVGDTVLLETGAEVPADGVITDSLNLSVNESTLTGEPQAYKETGEPLRRSSTILDGHATMVVDRVGDATEYGHIFQAVQIDNGVKTPLSIQLDDLGKRISVISFIIAGLIIVGRLAWLFIDGDMSSNNAVPGAVHGAVFGATPDVLDVIQYLLQSVMIAVTLIAVAVPEGLPLSITMSLALSMRKMLRENNLVRKLHACETMGAATVICTDKTGTLTQNQMRVHEMLSFCPLSDLATAISVNSTAWLDNATVQGASAPCSSPATPAVNGSSRVIGNPTEGALLLWLRDQGFDYTRTRESYNIISQQQFSTETKMMRTTITPAVLGPDSAVTGSLTFIKGAPEKVLALCRDIPADVESTLYAWQNQAMRTLAFACERDGVTSLQAVCAISDPIRPEVPAAISTCHQAGIRVIIVTGDTPGTASEIGRQIGILPSSHYAVNGVPTPSLAVNGAIPLTLTGAEFGAMSDAELRDDVLPSLAILSRARPADKERLVRLLQSMHHVVAVTGDGTNDAPALNAAHVGLSMGDGTAVAKEASDITIIDNSFTSITKAVLWGRSLYRNIGRFILFQMTVNIAACFIVLAGAFLGKESPLTVTQMLWVNLIMDTFAAMALSALPPEPSVMSDKPRSRKAHIIDRRMLYVCFGWGITMSLSLILSWEFLPHHLFFTVFVMMQFWNLFNARYFRTGRSFFVRHGQPYNVHGCRGFLFIALLIIVGQILIVELGGEMFNITQPLSLTEWLLITLATSPIFFIGELIRILLPLRAESPMSVPSPGHRPGSI